MTSDNTRNSHNDVRFAPVGMGSWRDAATSKLREIDLSSTITADRVRQCLDYLPDTGVLLWRDGCRSQRHVGKIAGSFDIKGYRLIKIDQVVCKAHRLAWLYMTGAHAAGEIDHINGDRSDNRFSNLRDVPVNLNRQNRRNGIGAVGVLGVSLSYGRFRATIKVNRDFHHLGLFDAAEAAHAAYVEAKRKLHPGGML